MRHIIIILLASCLLISCNQKKENPLVFTTSLWVGFTPLIYAQEKGMLKDANIKLHIVSSLGESSKLYDSGLIMGFTATQYEAEKAKAHNLIPVLLFDISEGADRVLSTMTKEQLKAMKSGEINIYYEFDTVNELLLDAVLKKRHMVDTEKVKLNFFNMDQENIALHDFNKENAIVVTYEPYCRKLLKNGMIEILSSADKDILIFDALFITKKDAKLYKNDIAIMKKAVILAQQELKKSPKAYFSVINNYTKGSSYDEFMDSLSGVRLLTEIKKDDRLYKLLTNHYIDISELSID